MASLAYILAAQSEKAAATAAAAAFITFFTFIMLFVVAVLVLSIVAYWKIAAKAGYNGAWSLLTLVPVGNLILLFLFAFTEWPIEQEVRRLHAAAAGTHPAG